MTDLQPFGRLLFIGWAHLANKRYRSDRFAWARRPCEHFEARPISQHKGMRPDPAIIDEERPDEG